MTNNFFRNQLMRLLGLIFLMGIVHFFLLKDVLPQVYQNSQPWKIYLILVPLEIVGLAYIFFKYKKDDQSAMKSFMLLMGVKMAASIAFLAPWALFQDKFSRPIIYQFFVVFFVILFAELVFLVKMLARKVEK